MVNHKAFPFILVNVFALFSFLDFAFSETSAAGDCILDIKNPSSAKEPDCESANWAGFIDAGCCGGAFEEYIHALGRRANLTKAIYLNTTQQNNCLAAMEIFEKDVYSCGIQKLTSGAGGCSDYTITDVIDKMGDRLRSLQEDCRVLGTGNGSHQSCGTCLRSWEQINLAEHVTGDADVCRFAALVYMISNRVDDDNWVLAVFQCLGERAYSLDEHGSTTSKNIHKNGNRNQRKEQILPARKNESDDSFSKHSSSQKISIKEVYSATNYFNASNFIGQGIAGKVYKGLLSNGQYVAVKHIINDGQIETFVREVRSLSHIKHPNLVALVGYCENKDECFLVYELCHHGNLSEWLYGKDRAISWIQRLKIAIDGARGLWFLHTYPEGCIVHHDIKVHSRT
ncbi:probable receptor-like protein kinase At2g39360 [Hibiscus syriacus]|uniref:probable receptor-like protein kinase At2g39360 n=1 Tax=Hibiscus syriacus TaxID=106335 RepID=UPI0019248EA5|nr:probable receptor-like protein kinase At2g39360 [Hibiscus syriacus]